MRFLEALTGLEFAIWINLELGTSRRARFQCETPRFSAVSGLRIQRRAAELGAEGRLAAAPVAPHAHGTAVLEESRLAANLFGFVARPRGPRRSAHGPSSPPPWARQAMRPAPAEALPPPSRCPAARTFWPPAGSLAAPRAGRRPCRPQRRAAAPARPPGRGRSSSERRPAAQGLEASGFDAFSGRGARFEATDSFSHYDSDSDLAERPRKRSLRTT